MNYWEGTMDSLNVDYKTAAVGDLWPPAETLRDQWRPSAARQNNPIRPRANDQHIGCAVILFGSLLTLGTKGGLVITSV